MALITWSDALSVGFHDIDSDHKLLISLLNQLDDAISEGEGKETVGSVINVLADYTSYHFRREEMLMEACGYAELSQHRKDHENLKEKVLKIQKSYAGDPASINAGEVLEFLKDWLTGHIMHIDKKFQECLDNNPEKAEKANLAFERMMVDELRGDMDDGETGLF